MDDFESYDDSEPNRIFDAWTDGWEIPTNGSTIDTWTKWVIPLQKFAEQGVNLTNVDSIAIGFGDKDNLQAGGSGTVFFDDIGVGRSAPEPKAGANSN